MVRYPGRLGYAAAIACECTNPWRSSRQRTNGTLTNVTDEDAAYLFGDGRLGNADHLYGLSAECALKAILAGTKFSGPGLPGEYRIHIDKLWERFRSLAEDRYLARYAASLPQDNPFSDWQISQRYRNRTIFVQRTVENHRGAAQDVRKLLRDFLYDEAPPESPGEEDQFTFDLNEEDAPHWPLEICWRRGVPDAQTVAELPRQTEQEAFAPFLEGFDDLMAEQR